MEQDTRGTGEKISSMVTGRRLGLMVPATRESTKMEKKMASESSTGLMDPLIRVNLLTITFMVSAYTHGLMAASTMAIG
jgi:hypothetical protein